MFHKAVCEFKRNVANDWDNFSNIEQILQVRRACARSKRRSLMLRVATSTVATWGRQTKRTR